MDRLDAAIRHLTLAVGELANIIPQPHTAKALALDLIAECQDILDEQLTLEEGDASGPSAAIAAGADAANKGDPEGPLEDPASLFSPEAPANDRERAGVAETAAYRKLCAHLDACEERLAGVTLGDRECVECRLLYAKHCDALAAFVETTRSVAA